jgi:hypothetical protein
MYTVGCEPALGHYQHARDFMVSVADITGGQAVPLASAEKLAAVILGGTREEIGLEKLMDAVQRDIAEAEQEAAQDLGCAACDLSEKEVASRVHSKMATRGVQSVQMHAGGRMMSKHKDIFKASLSLKACKAELASKGLSSASYSGAPEMCRASRSARPAPSSSMMMMRKSKAPKAPLAMSHPADEDEYCSVSLSAAPEEDEYRSVSLSAAPEAPVECYSASVTEEQVSRMYRKSKARSAGPL